MEPKVDSADRQAILEKEMMELRLALHQTLGEADKTPVSLGRLVNVVQKPDPRAG
jgi:hypothetical protein